MRERQPAHEATADLRAFDSVRYAVSSLFGGEGSAETTAYLESMKAKAEPHKKAITEDANFEAAAQALQALGATLLS